jgi:hypothetical protein
VHLEAVGAELAREHRQDALCEDLQPGDRRDPAQVADHQDAGLARVLDVRASLLPGRPTQVDDRRRRVPGLDAL